MLTDLELRAIHAQINPHFIFNTLSTALYFISRREYDNAYGHVNKFSHLLRSYLKSSHDRYVLLSEEIDMLKRYVDLQQTRFEEKFDFELNVDNKIPVNNIQIPSLLLQPLVENAINHGLFHRKDKGLLKLSFGQGTTSDHLIVIIDDNGIGRAEAMRLKQESAADKESYGSQLTQKLMDIFRRYEAMDIEIQYIDKELPQTGTIVRLMIGNIRYIV
jgi:LytS/YehU family sensor histidine kinase